MNDLCALGAIEAAEKAGRRVGKDIAVMGIDNLEMSGVSRISLTSIDKPYDRIIELAARAMISSIEKNMPCIIRKRLKPSLVIRASTNLMEAPVAG
jgi:DNA-binding LacI/PurR family transcriptional regulator